MATHLTHFGFWIFDFGLSEEETSHRIQCFLFMLFSPNPKSKI